MNPDHESSIAVTAAQAARIALTIAQECQTLVWVESTASRDLIALRRAGDAEPLGFVDRDGHLLSRVRAS